MLLSTTSGREGGLRGVDFFCRRVNLEMGSPYMRIPIMCILCCMVCALCSAVSCPAVTSVGEIQGALR